MLSLRVHLASYVAESPELANNIDQNQGGTIMCQMFAGQDPATYESDIPQMTSKFGKIVPPFQRQGNGIPSAAIRWPDFGRPRCRRMSAHGTKPKFKGATF